MERAKIKKGILVSGIIVLVFGGMFIYQKKEDNRILGLKVEAEKKEQIDQEKRMEEEKKVEEEKRVEEEKKKIEEEKKKLEKKKVEEEKKKVEEEKKKLEENKKLENEQKVEVKPENKPKPEVKPEQVKPKTLAEKIANTKTAKKTNQIITVIGRRVSLWNKSGNEFKESIKVNGRVGQGGMTSASNKREGDKKTPTGVYPILYGFGTGGNPGTSFQYRQITENSYFVDDVNSKYYNQWYEGTDQKGEHMIKFSKQYKYGLVIGYNMSNIKGKGSAIFLHANGNGNTAGCVSIPENDMLNMMREVKPGAQIIITTSEENLKNY